MAPTAPKLTAEQRKAALAKAQEARRVRAEVKELLKTGAMSLSELFERAEGDELVAGMKIEAVVRSLPGVGKVAAKRFLEEHDISDSRRIRGLGSRQREVLLEAFS